MIPAELTGGWVRQGISLGDQPLVEDSVVWWLQAESAHADLRVGLSEDRPPTSFAGTTSWDGTALTWTRQIDLEGFDGVDVGIVSWDGPDLLESGTFDVDGVETSYTERWVRLPGSEGPLVAVERGEERLVRAGGYAITLADRRTDGGLFTATAWALKGGQWRVHHTLADAPLATNPAALLA